MIILIFVEHKSIWGKPLLILICLISPFSDQSGLHPSRYLNTYVLCSSLIFTEIKKIRDSTTFGFQIFGSLLWLIVLVSFYHVHLNICWVEDHIVSPLLQGSMNILCAFLGQSKGALCNRQIQRRWLCDIPHFRVLRIYSFSSWCIWFRQKFQVVWSSKMDNLDQSLQNLYFNLKTQAGRVKT